MHGLRLALIPPLLLALTALPLAAQQAPVPPKPEVEWLTPFGTPSRPFSPATRIGNLIFLSGQIGTTADAGGELVPGGIEAETRQTLLNIRRVLDLVGSGMDRVLKCTVMMADMAEWDRMNAVYREMFPPGRLPARSAFGATALALNARVEIECIAAAN